MIRQLTDKDIALVCPLPGILRFMIDDVCMDKPMTRDQLLSYAQRFLKAAMETPESQPMV